MPDFAPISQTELLDRRQSLRRQRRFKLLQTLWRSIAISGLTAGLIWVATLPIWLIRSPEQIEIQGNQLLSTETIHTLLPIAYPQSLLEVKPQVVAAHLTSQAHIAEAIVSRRIFPSGLEIRVRERRPVALSLPDSLVPKQGKNAAPQLSQVGLLDANGIWMPHESFTFQEQASSLPTLKVRGMRENYRSAWISLYQTISRSPIEVLEIDWRDPNNLILHTELGTVHMGPYTSKFPMQLSELDRMRNIRDELKKQMNNHFRNKEIDYIDLTNPTQPIAPISSDNSLQTSGTP
ncbi:MAG: FtsQ-type POTRA domain-containing protein [Leptolyngbyaceae cyanobacterium MO_188.B28]|nr:FtsQ-type POTRA domain-containing protein [Leptolyngbyaceae cyanobacterium MO_188.B28]